MQCGHSSHINGGPYAFGNRVRDDCDAPSKRSGRYYAHRPGQKVQILVEPGSVFTKVRVLDDEEEVKEETSLRSGSDGKSEQDITLLKSLTSW